MIKSNTTSVERRMGAIELLYGPFRRNLPVNHKDSLRGPHSTSLRALATTEFSAQPHLVVTAFL